MLHNLPSGQTNKCPPKVFNTMEIQQKFIELLMPEFKSVSDLCYRGRCVAVSCYEWGCVVKTVVGNNNVIFNLLEYIQ